MLLSWNLGSVVVIVVELVGGQDLGVSITILVLSLVLIIIEQEVMEEIKTGL
tara:strand:- start:214 stop:369 length:156 start_codon:yes stop_codon:yes gene_type:complete